MKYSRLTGKKRSFTGFTQLWLGGDHILLVRSTRFMEHYQRFAFSDIQSIVVTELPQPVAYQILILAGILGGAAAFFSVSSIFGKIVFGAGALWCFASMLFNVFAGPRCRCVLQTAISTEPLKSVAHLRTARKFLRRIRPLIESAQGSLDPERAAAVDVPVESPVKPPELVRSPGYLPETLFILFLVNAALVVASVRYPRAQLGSVLFSTIFGEVVIIVVALMRRPGRDSRRIIYGIMIAAIFFIAWDAYQIASNLAGWMNGVVDAARRGDPGPPPSVLNWLVFNYNAAAFAAIWRIAAGAFGLAAAHLERP